MKTEIFKNQGIKICSFDFSKKNNLKVVEIYEEIRSSSSFPLFIQVSDQNQKIKMTSGDLKLITENIEDFDSVQSIIEFSEDYIQFFEAFSKKEILK